MKVGLFGGTFDPPHYGHLAVARAGLECCGLDRVLMAPTGRQPLKDAAPGASFSQRLMMVELLCEGAPAIAASDVDAPLPEGAANYTIDAIGRLRQTFLKSAAGVEVFVITGIDAFLDIRRWHRPDDLLAAAEWIVVSRPGVALDLASLQLTPTQRARVRILDDIHVEVSATEVRERLHEHRDVQGLLPERVSAYIREHHLYKR